MDIILGYTASYPDALHGKEAVQDRGTSKSNVCWDDPGKGLSLTCRTQCF